MLRNYIKIAWRNLVRTKGYSFINVGGLAIGMAVAMLIGLWIYDELSYNKYHKNYDRIAQVMIKGHFAGQGFSSVAQTRPLEGALRNKYGSNFRHIVMSRWNEGHNLSAGDKNISQSGRFMQPGAPEMLSLKMIKGTRKALEDPSSIMLSASVAKSLFGDADPMNKTVQIDKHMNVQVTGVYEDLPANSEFSNLKFLSSWDLLMANNKWMQDAVDKWTNSSFLIYVQLQPNTTFEGVSAKIKNAITDNFEDAKKFNIEVFLNPMSRWHLFSEWKNGVNAGGRIQYVWMFCLTGVFVLLLACINFMNLATARSEKRAKEVGIRKTVGSLRSQLIRQFLSESFLVVLLAFVVALFMVIASLPWFNELAGKSITFAWSNTWFWLVSLVFVIITSLVAGSYPALYLSSFNPVKVLKGTFRVGRYASLPRKVLVVVQYTISVALIIGTIIVYNQVQHAKNRPVGYSRDGLLMIQMMSAEYKEKIDVLRNELKATGVVAHIAQSASPVTAVRSNNGGLTWKDKDPDKQDGFGTIWVTHDYGKTVGWDFIDGRDFSAQMKADSITTVHNTTMIKSVVMNEAAVKYMELKNPVGEIIKWDGIPLQITGIIKDMLMESPFEPVRPIMYLVNYDEANGGWMNIRLNPAVGTGEALQKIEAAFKKVLPAVPFEYKFADTEYGNKFRAEERVGKLSSVFAFLAVLISCLGLFGLASFIAEKRTKEIGVRKVLGASVFILWKMLSKDFVLLVIISCLIAVPLAWYFMHGWLQQYDYRTEINGWVFVLAILGAMIITLFTVSFQAIKAAMSNPVKSLRSE